MVVGSGRGRIMRQNSSLAIIWLLWKEGNSTCFEDKASSSDALPQQAKFNVAFWEFQGISIINLTELAGDHFHFGLEGPLLTHPLPHGLLSLTLMGVQQVTEVPQQVSALSTEQKWKLCGQAFKQVSLQLRVHNGGRRQLDGQRVCAVLDVILRTQSRRSRIQLRT